MAKTLALDTAKKRKIVMGAAALGAAGLIGWGTAMTALYSCSSATVGPGYVPNYDPHLKDITQELKITLTEEADKIPGHQGLRIIHVQFSTIDGSTPNWNIPTAIRNFTATEAANPEILKQCIEEYFQGQAVTDEGPAFFTNLLMGILFGGSLPDDINEDLDGMLFIDGLTHKISIFGQDPEGALDKSIIDAANNRGDGKAQIDIGLGIDAAFGGEVVDDLYVNNNATQFTFQTSSAIEFQYNGDDQGNDSSKMAENFLGKFFVPLFKNQVHVEAKSSGLVGDNSGSSDDGGSFGDNFPPCRIRFQTGKYDFAIWNYHLNYNFFGAYMMSPYLSRSTSRPTSAMLGQAGLIGRNEAYNPDPVKSGGDGILGNIAATSDLEKNDFLGILSNFDKTNPEVYSDPSVAILPVIDESEHIRDSGIQLRLYNEALDPSPGHPNAYPVDPDFQVYGNMAFVMNNVRSGVLADDTGEEDTTTGIDNKTKESAMKAMSAPAYLTFLPGLLVNLALWATPVDLTDPQNVFLTNRNALNSYINTSSTDTNIVATANNKSMNSGVDAINTELAKDRLLATTGGYTNIKALASKLGGAELATPTASGNYGTLSSFQPAKEWLIDRMKTVDGAGAYLKLQYMSGTPGNYTYSDVSDYSAIGSLSYTTNVVGAEEGLLYTNYVQNNKNDVGYLVPQNNEGDKFASVGGSIFPIQPNLQNSNWSNPDVGNLSITVTGGSEYQIDDQGDGTWVDIDSTTVGEKWVAFGWNNGADTYYYNIENTPDSIAANGAIGCVKVSFAMSVAGSQGIESQTTDMYIFPDGTVDYNNDDDNWNKTSVKSVGADNDHFLLTDEDSGSKSTKLHIQSKAGPEIDPSSITWTKVASENVTGAAVQSDGTVSFSSIGDSVRGSITARASWIETVKVAKVEGPSPDEPTDFYEVEVPRTKDMVLPVYHVVSTDSWQIGYGFRVNLGNREKFITRATQFSGLEDSWKYELENFRSGSSVDYLGLSGGISMLVNESGFSLSMNNNLVTMIQCKDTQLHGATTQYRVLVRYEIYNGGNISPEFIEGNSTYVTFAFPIAWTWDN